MVMDKMEKTVRISTSGEKEEVVAELWSGENRLGELSKKDNITRLKILPPTDGSWNFELEDFIEFLRQAEKEFYSQHNE